MNDGLNLHSGDKTKSMGTEQAAVRKSQDISHVVEPEKVPTKKSIYLKAAEFLLKFNIATVNYLWFR